jgi:hypothetical protein
VILIFDFGIVPSVFFFLSLNYINHTSARTKQNLEEHDVTILNLFSRNIVKINVRGNRRINNPETLDKIDSQTQDEDKQTKKKQQKQQTTNNKNTQHILLKR